MRNEVPHSEAVQDGMMAGVSGSGGFASLGEYDTVVPAKPLDAFWDALQDNGARRIRKSYRATHSLMGCRRALARDLAEFIVMGDAP